MSKIKKPVIIGIIATVIVLVVVFFVFFKKDSSDESEPETTTKSENASILEKICIDHTSFDIDGDGKKEDCFLNYGNVHGAFTFELYVLENGKYEYFNVYSSDYYSLSFVEIDGKLKVQGVTADTIPKTFTFDMAIKDGNIYLSIEGNALEFYGTQGVDSPLKRF